VNIEHPLVGKLLIALGITLFGDTPLGWRAMSTLAGTATVLAVFAIVKALTGRTRAALLGGVFALTGGTIFVQARIAMLDGFMAALLACGLACLLWALKSERPWPRWLIGSMLLGLAVGTKWTALPYVGFAGLGVLILRRRAGVPFAVTLGIVSAISYFATFLPAFFYASEPLTLATLLPFQLDMYARQTQVLPPHVYQSNWWSWPLMIRPIWYFWEPSDGAQRGILLIANPALAWGSLIAVTSCLWFAVRDRSLRLVAPAALWLVSILMWAAVPKSLGFFYYYYPSTVWLAVVAAVAIDRIDRPRLDEWMATLSIGVFAFFWPILSAAPADGFSRWTWFRSWV
jgi:dolichyl-phosphate-mannose--protein O-mannosyl transferase